MGRGRPKKKVEDDSLLKEGCSKSGEDNQPPRKKAFTKADLTDQLEEQKEMVEKLKQEMSKKDEEAKELAEQREKYEKLEKKLKALREKVKSKGISEEKPNEVCTLGCVFFKI